MLRADESHHFDAGSLGLIMAGGRSERMRSTFGPMHKGMVPILGVPLLERNICALVAKGIRRIIVAINEREIGMRNYVYNRAQRILGSVGGNIECFEEGCPLGTIGAAGRLSRHTYDQLLVTNVDNLTTLDWRQMLSCHRRRGAAMTVAAHWQPLQSPLGELTVEDGNVSQYNEKPVKKWLISSGSYVLEEATCHLIPSGQSTDAPELVKLLLDGLRPVAAFQHEYPWIDINDAESLAEGERLVALHCDEFECWHPWPQAERLHLLVCSGGHIFAERHMVGEALPEWDLPEGAVEGNLEASAARIWRKFEPGIGNLRFLGAYDDFDESSGSVTRRHIFLCVVPLPASMASSGEHLWIPLEHLAQDARMSSVMSRAVSLVKNLP